MKNMRIKLILRSRWFSYHYDTGVLELRTCTCIKYVFSFSYSFLACFLRLYFIWHVAWKKKKRKITFANQEPFCVVLMKCYNAAISKIFASLYVANEKSQRPKHLAGSLGQSGAVQDLSGSGNEGEGGKAFKQGRPLSELKHVLRGCRIVRILLRNKT